MTRSPVRLTAAVLAPLCIAGAARAQDVADFAAITTRLETAALAGATTAIKDGRTACLRLLAAAPDGEQAALVRYTIAYADWRLAFAPQVSGAEQVGFLQEADEQLHAALKAKPSFADAMGLLSAVYGGEISKNPDLKMTLGMESSTLLSNAAHLEPDNPRLLVLTGQNQLKRPPEYGGSAKDAAATLRRAIALLDAEPAARPWPNWGRFDAHAWLGQALAAMGDKPGAKAEYEKALAIAPDNGYVRYTLLPAVSK